MMKPPKFWYDPSQAIPFGLSKLSGLYEVFSSLRIARAPRYTSPLPVICVGNVTMGGSGKTPIVQSLARILNDHDHCPAILMRGYGGKVKGPTWVTGQSADQVGDEALLHVGIAPTMIARNRVRGAKAIEKNSSITHILMDDGLQNPDLSKTLSFLVVNGQNPFGNGHIFPSGPLREPVDNAIRRSQALVVMGDDTTDLASRYQFAMQVFHAKLVPQVPKQFTGLPIIAFAGIGNPGRFFQTLEDHQAILFDKITFPDHHLYTKRDLDRLHQISQKSNIPLVTTRKDWVRLPPAFQPHVHVLDVTLEWQDEGALVQFLREKGLL
jgi:tetraacyldisaccharide 4'-kinase